MSSKRVKGGLTGQKADERSRNRQRLADLVRASGAESGGGGGERDITEALLLAAMHTPFGRGGLSNSGDLSRAALHHALRRRSGQSRAEGFFAEEHVGYSPNIAVAGLGLARQADPRVVSQVLGVDVQRVHDHQRDLRVQDVDRVLRADYHTGRIERAARTSMQLLDPVPDTPPEHRWRRGLDENLDVSRMNARELALNWLSAANSNEPGAREAQERFFGELAQKHPQLAESIERGMVRDPGFTGRTDSARIDANSVMAGASWQADGRPMETMEEYWAKAVPWFKDDRADLNRLRDTAESVFTASLDGRVPAAVGNELVRNAAENRALPGFAQDYREGRELAGTRADRGGAEVFVQGEAFLHALDKARGAPLNEGPRDRAGAIAAGNAAKAELRAHDATRAADPRLVLGDSRLPGDRGQLDSALTANGRAVVRPQELGRHERQGTRAGNDRTRRTRQDWADRTARAAVNDPARRLPRQRGEQRAAVRRLTARTALRRQERSSINTTRTRTGRGA
ncbi:hypothetical protein [Nocardiopsis dassonvillei]|uniref:hypothetical protein n=1 Tax=Nocardiopsis dassonvillei TaxID=2014 RepID=UPI00366F0762